LQQKYALNAFNKNADYFSTNIWLNLKCLLFWEKFQLKLDKRKVLFGKELF